MWEERNKIHRPALIRVVFISFVFGLFAVTALAQVAIPPQVQTSEPSTANKNVAEPVDLRIVLAGDINFNRNRVEVHSEGMDVWGTTVPFDQFAGNIKGLIDGDVNFGNVETVISDHNNLPVQDKAYCFRSHPNGMRVLLKSGFNLFSLANNHTYDYGAPGVMATLEQLAMLEKEATFGWTGIGKNKNQAITPAVLNVKGIKVAMVAVGIGHGAGPDSPGMAQEYYYREALQQLKDTQADLRIFSCHDGKEGRNIPIDRQLRMYREAIADFGVDIVVGHHPHIVQGVELFQDGIIFYSLGNFMIRGCADMGKHDYQKDFGLLARVNLTVTKGKPVQMKRIEIVPVYDMHQGPHPFASTNDVYQRVDAVNELSSLSLLNQAWTHSLYKSTAKKSLVFGKKDAMGVYEFPVIPKPKPALEKMTPEIPVQNTPTTSDPE